MGTPTGGSGMGNIHKQDLKMEKFLGDIGSIKNTHGENKSNVMNWVENARKVSNSNPMTASKIGQAVANWVDKASDITNKLNKIDTGSPNPSEGGNSRFRSIHSVTGKGKGAKYKPGELEKTASSYTEPTNPEDK